MQMTNPELAEYLNVQLGLAGSEAVSANVIRQWVAWDVLPKAGAQGRSIGESPLWVRSAAAMRRALRLAELRKRGITRENALIVQAYIEWGHDDLDRVRSALIGEWSKSAKQLIRRQTTFLNDKKFDDVSATKKRAIANQTGPLDFIFGGTPFEQSDGFYAQFAELSQTGKDNSNSISGLMNDAMARMSPGIATILPANLISAFANSFAGMTGPPDEIDNSGESTIQIASERQFRIARFYVRSMLRQFRTIGHVGEDIRSDPVMSQLLQFLHMLNPQISIGQWAVFLFIQALKIQLQGPEICQKRL